jgi:hypothetical protein
MNAAAIFLSLVIFDGGSTRDADGAPDEWRQAEREWREDFQKGSGPNDENLKPKIQNPKSPKAKPIDITLDWRLVEDGQILVWRASGRKSLMGGVPPGPGQSTYGKTPQELRGGQNWMGGGPPGVGTPTEYEIRSVQGAADRRGERYQGYQTVQGKTKAIGAASDSLLEAAEIVQRIHDQRLAKAAKSKIQNPKSKTARSREPAKR